MTGWFPVIVEGGSALVVCVDTLGGLNPTVNVGVELV